MTPLEEVLFLAGVTRDELGRQVREAWIAWAAAQHDPKPSWLVPYDQLGEDDREADRQIGERLFAAGWRARWVMLRGVP